SIAYAFELGSQLNGGWISAASTPATSISLRQSSAVKLLTLRCRPDGGTTASVQMCTWASMIFMASYFWSFRPGPDPAASLGLPVAVIVMACKDNAPQREKWHGRKRG